MKKSLGNFRLPLPLGMQSQESHGQPVLVIDRPTAKSPGQGPLEPKPADSEFAVGEVILRGPVPEANDDGFVGTYDVSAYSIFYFPKHGNSARISHAQRMTRPKRQTDYSVLFVNGMQGNPDKFRAQACATAAVSGGDVTGVFNAGESFGSDLMQCVTDKFFSNDWLNLKVEAWKLFSSPTQAEIDNYVFRQLNESNRATASLFRQLLDQDGVECRVVAHSQGNIISCNALNGVYAARGKEGVRNIKMYAIASPVVFWSNAKSCLKNGAELNFSNDLVSWLGFNAGREPYLIGWSATGKVGNTEITEIYDSSAMNLATHQFYIYLEKYWKLLQSHFE